MECPHAAGCPLLALFRRSSSLRIWHRWYCGHGFDACARYQLAERGARVPRNLLPNGDEVELEPAA